MGLMLFRRVLAGIFLALAGCSSANKTSTSVLNGIEVNDIHSHLNATTVASVSYPSSVDELQQLVTTAKEKHLKISITGGRHAMGGQQFAEGALLSICLR